MSWLKRERLAPAVATSLLAISAALAILILLPSASCDFFCDCAGVYNEFRIGSRHAVVPISTLSVAGNACADAVCQEFASGGGCLEFTVPLKQPGSCHLVAKATDGRQSSADLSVQYSKTTCCGKMYSVGADDIDLPFASADAGGD